MRLKHFNHDFLNNIGVQVFDDNDKCAEEPLLEDPNVSVFFEQNTRQGGFEEFGPDQVFLLEKGLDAVHQLLCFGCRGLLESFEHKFIEVVKCSHSVCLHLKGRVSHCEE